MCKEFFSQQFYKKKRKPRNLAFSYETRECLWLRSQFWLRVHVYTYVYNWTYGWETVKLSALRCDSTVCQRAPPALTRAPPVAPSALQWRAPRAPRRLHHLPASMLRLRWRALRLSRLRRSNGALRAHHRDSIALTKSATSAAGRGVAGGVPNGLLSYKVLSKVLSYFRTSGSTFVRKYYVYTY